MSQPTQNLRQIHPSTRPVSAPLPQRSALPGPLLRIGDAERDLVCTELAEHYAAGRLSSAEMDERTELAVNARTNRDLLALTADLPLKVEGRLPHDGQVLTRGGSHRGSPLATSAANAAGALAVSMFGFVSMMAVICTVLLLAVLGMGRGDLFSVASLAAFGAAVGTSGLWYFMPRLFTINHR